MLQSVVSASESVLTLSVSDTNVGTLLPWVGISGSLPLQCYFFAENIFVNFSGALCVPNSPEPNIHFSWKILTFLELPWMDDVLHHEKQTNKRKEMRLPKLETLSDQVITSIIFYRAHVVTAYQ